MYSNQYFYHYSPQYNDYYRMPNDIQLINDIQKAINAEYSAVACYERLAKMAPTKDETNKILEIQKDEKRHLEEFSKIYTNLTGKSHLIKLSRNAQTSIEQESNLLLKMNKKPLIFI